jgi:uncharacterized protein (UPF0333 family)
MSTKNENGMWSYSEKYGETISNVYIVRESKMYNGEWVDIVRPKCFTKFQSAKDYTTHQVDEIIAQNKFNGEEISVENLSSNKTTYITLRDGLKNMISRFEIYETPLLTC